MSQEMVERVLGRMITDVRFRQLAAVSLEEACLREGYCLSADEVRLLAGRALPGLAALSAQLDPGLCRASADSGDNGAG